MISAAIVVSGPVHTWDPKSNYQSLKSICLLLGNPGSNQGVEAGSVSSRELIITL